MLLLQKPKKHGKKNKSNKAKQSILLNLLGMNVINSIDTIRASQKGFISSPDIDGIINLIYMSAN